MDAQYHPVVLAADTTDYQANTLQRVGQGIALGIPAAAASGVLSIVNTGLDTFGGTPLDIEESVRRFGGDNMGDYYAEHKLGVDMVGFVGTAILPASLGVKGVQMLRGGNAAGNVGKYLSLASSRKDAALARALQEIATDGGAVKSILSSPARRAVLGWETADQMLLGAAAELAIAATMRSSPVFENKTAGDMASDAGLGIILSGAIGGPLGSIAAKGVLRAAEREIQTTFRKFDTVVNTGETGLLPGTDILNMTESIIKLPDVGVNTPFKYKTNGREVSVDLPTSSAVMEQQAKALKVAESQLMQKFTSLAGGDAVVGNTFYASLKSGLQAAKSIGMDADQQFGLVYGYLNRLASASPVNPDQMVAQSKKFYLVLDPIAVPADQLSVKSLLSATRTATTSKQAYRLKDGVTADQLVMEQITAIPGAKSVHSAFTLRPDLDAVQLENGTFRINPRSQNITKLRENPRQVTQIMDLESLSLSPETVLSFGDIVNRSNLVHTVDGIYSGGRSFKQAAVQAVDIAADPVLASARFAWASRLTPQQLMKVLDGTLDTADIALLDRVIELSGDATMRLDGLHIVYKDEVLQLGVDAAQLGKLAEATRLRILEEQLAVASTAANGVPDTRALAIHLNTDRAWVEAAIERGYVPTTSESVAGRIHKTEEALNPRSVQLTWDFGDATKKMTADEAYKMNMGPNHAMTAELTQQYQTQIRTKISDTAVAAALGEDAVLIPSEAEFFATPGGPRMSQQTAESGAGAGLATSSNAGYGERAKLFVQELGKNVANISQKRADAVIGTLAPEVNALRLNVRAGAELGALTTALRKSQYRYTFHPDNELRLISQPVKELAEQSFEGDIEQALKELIARDGGKATRSPHVFDVESPEVISFLRTTTQINNKRQGKMIQLFNAAGLPVRENAGMIYVPPINTAKYPHHAFVRPKPQLGLADDVGVITAKDETQLRKLAASVSSDYEVSFKGDDEAYFKAKGIFDYQMTLHEGRVNSDLARRGVLADFFPEMRLENVMTDWLEWHVKQEEKLVRTATQVKNRQFFSEVSMLSETYRRIPESQVRSLGSKLKARIVDPFGDYIKTALNISKQQEFPLLDSLNDFIDKVGYKAGEVWERSFRDAKAGLISWEQSGDILERYGLPRVYDSTGAGAEAFYAANERLSKNLIREFFQKTNSALATTTLRLDFMNSLVNTISTPIMLATEVSSIRQMMKDTPELAGKFAELTSIKVPGKDFTVPSTTKLIANSINNYFGKESNALIARYKEIGSIKEVAMLHKQILDDFAIDPLQHESALRKKLSSGIEKAASITGNNFSEEFTRFVSADVIKQMSDPLVKAGKMTMKEQNAYISTFVNRVQGNYVTSQRPVIFQGTTGAAVSLFQTYAFNVLQQLYRHVERGDKKTLAIFAGMQASIFGMNGLPFFDAVNAHIIGSEISGNDQHHDAYSVLPAFNKELGDWLLYGTASAFPVATGAMPALFSRGDINPRHISILPNSIADVPAVSASIKLVSEIYDFGKNVSQGADVTNSLFHALEHQGWNRPLAGFAQALSGRTTTSQGALISAANEFETTAMLSHVQDRAIDFGGVWRVLGSRPMDEALALNAMYREKRYDAMDKARIERLGTVVKSKLYSGAAPTDEEYQDFLLRYTRSGGRVETFNQAWMRWTRDANESVVNQMIEKNKDPFAQKMMTIMGGTEGLPD